ncbi:MAG TPA: hypothetical protein VFX14_16305 [Methylomirabilota bacterium]|nr:hypothetical protein [Methylomirabilota bacterium]
MGDRLRRVGLLIFLALPAPAWGQASGGRWEALPGTSLRALVPPGSAGSAVTAAWSGAAYDSRRQRLIVIGGGHADSWWNGAVAVYADGRASRLVAEPSQTPPPRPGNPVDPNPDGVPTSRHTYAGLAYVSHLDAVWMVGGSGYSGSGGGLRTSWLLHLGETPARWEQLPDAPGSTVTAMIDYDPTRRLGYFVARNGALHRYDFDAGVWERVIGPQPAVAEPDPALMFRIDPERRLALFVGPRCGYATQGAGVYKGAPCDAIQVISLDDLNAGAQRWTFTGATDFFRVQGPGLAKHPSGLWYGWAGQNEVWTMDLDAKVLVKLPAGPLPVPEGSAINRGVYGRWAFDAARGAFFGIAHVDWNAVRFTPLAHP